jgi:hypothetical protein
MPCSDVTVDTAVAEYRREQVSLVPAPSMSAASAGRKRTQTSPVQGNIETLQRAAKEGMSAAAGLEIWVLEIGNWDLEIERAEDNNEHGSGCTGTPNAIVRDRQSNVGGSYSVVFSSTWTRTPTHYISQPALSA